MIEFMRDYLFLGTALAAFALSDNGVASKAADALKPFVVPVRIVAVMFIIFVWPWVVYKTIKENT